jgi:hypothetical protein
VNSTVPRTARHTPGSASREKGLLGTQHCPWRRNSATSTPLTAPSSRPNRQKSPIRQPPLFLSRSTNLKNIPHRSDSLFLTSRRPLHPPPHCKNYIPGTGTLYRFGSIDAGSLPPLNAAKLTLRGPTLQANCVVVDTFDAREPLQCSAGREPLPGHERNVL